MISLTSLRTRLLSSLPDTMQAEAAQRFERHAPVLCDRLNSLYGAHADFLPWLGDLMESIGRLHAARPLPLLQQDAQRLAQPDWFASQHMLGYSTYVNRFGGNLRGVTARIPHLQELGVTYLHLLPFLRYRAGDSDGGFAVASFEEVDPSVGTNADLEVLTTQLRAAGISLCSDLILNHVANDHAWAVAAAQGDVEKQAYFHTFPDRTMPDRYDRTLGQIFPQAAPGNFTFVPAMQRWAWTTFYPYQWDLNYANPAVLASMVEAMLGLANKGIEVFRLDSTAFLWKREGTNCMNQPEAHSILQVIRAILEIAAPGVLLKAEAIVPTPELPAYFGSAAAPECHIAYHSSLMAAGWGALAEQDTDLLRKVISFTPPLPPAASWLSYVRCHDDIGWNVLRHEARADANDATMGQARLAKIAAFFAGAEGSYSAGVSFQAASVDAAHGSNGMAMALVGLETAATPEEQASALRRLVLLQGLAFSFGAMPVLYMGDELGLGNDYSYADDPLRSFDSRWLQRPVFDDTLLTQRHDVETLPGQVFSAVNQMLAARRQYPALAAAAERTLLDHQHGAVLALGRGADFINLSNFSAAELTYQLPEGQWLDVLSGGAYDGAIKLDSWAMFWLKRAH